MKTDFCTDITENVGKLLSFILEAEGTSLFRRALPRVVLGLALDENSPDYHLYFMGHQKLETDAGSMRLSDGQWRLPSL
jgi:hypothetical protein